MAVSKYKNKSMTIGKIYETNNFGKLVVLEYINSKNVIVEFLATGYKVTTQAVNIKKGNVKDYLKPTVYSIGFMGNGKYSNKTHPKFYKIWHKMFERSYDPKRHERQPAYIGTSVYIKWHNFQVFAQWCEDNYIEGYELDKDLLQEGIENKIYSPQNCVFLPKSINSFMTNKSSNNTTGFTGVWFNKQKRRYATQTYCFITKKHLFLGCFIDKEEASRVYIKARKKQCELAKQYMRKLGYWNEETIQKLR